MPLQVWPLLQIPQSSVPPHPSDAEPQSNPRDTHVVGVHALAHRLLMQVPPPGHVPQSSVPPHPSPRLPQFFPCAAHVVGAHVEPAGRNVAITMFQSVAEPKDIDADCGAVDVAERSSSPVASALELVRKVKPDPAAMPDTTAPTVVAA